MTWQKELIAKAEEVVKHGWGKVSMTVTANGRRRAFDRNFHDIDDDSQVKVAGYEPFRLEDVCNPKPATKTIAEFQKDFSKDVKKHHDSFFKPDIGDVVKVKGIKREIIGIRGCIYSFEGTNESCTKEELAKENSF